jgi:hypothetical protein
MHGFVPNFKFITHVNSITVECRDFESEINLIGISYLRGKVRFPYELIYGKQYAELMP